MKVNSDKEVQQFATSAQHVTLLCGWGFVGSSRSGGRQRQGTLVPMNMDRCRSENRTRACGRAGRLEREYFDVWHMHSPVSSIRRSVRFCAIYWKASFPFHSFLLFLQNSILVITLQLIEYLCLKTLNDNSVEMYISKHYTSPLWIFIFLLRLYFRKSPVSTGGQLSRAL